MTPDASRESFPQSPNILLVMILALTNGCPCKVCEIIRRSARQLVEEIQGGASTSPSTMNETPQNPPSGDPGSPPARPAGPDPDLSPHSPEV